MGVNTSSMEYLPCLCGSGSTTALEPEEKLKEGVDLRVQNFRFRWATKSVIEQPANQRVFFFKKWRANTMHHYDHIRGRKETAISVLVLSCWHRLKVET